MSGNKAIFLDSDPKILENNLKIVKNELEDEFEQIFGTGSAGASPSGLQESQDCKIVTPEPGLCIKCFKVNTEEKFFINLCVTDGIPAPEDISEEALTELLQSEKPSTYRIPMSISPPRLTKDKKNNLVDVCDIAINPSFFAKCERQLLFREFLIAIVLEALDDKYNLQVNDKNWLILKNRKFIGTLVTHRVQNRDVKSVFESYKNPSKAQKQLIEELDLQKYGPTKKLVQEINGKELDKLKMSKIEATTSNQKSNAQTIKESISIANSIIPNHKIFSIKSGSKVKQILAEFYLPECITANEITLDIGEDRIYLEAMKSGYLFDKFIEFKINQNEVEANFNRLTKMLQIRMSTDSEIC